MSELKKEIGMVSFSCQGGTYFDGRVQGKQELVLNFLERRFYQKFYKRRYQNGELPFMMWPIYLNEEQISAIQELLATSDILNWHKELPLQEEITGAQGGWEIMIPDVPDAYVNGVGQPGEVQQDFEKKLTAILQDESYPIMLFESFTPSYQKQRFLTKNQSSLGFLVEYDNNQIIRLRKLAETNGNKVSDRLTWELMTIGTDAIVVRTLKLMTILEPVMAYDYSLNIEKLQFSGMMMRAFIEYFGGDSNDWQPDGFAEFGYHEFPRYLNSVDEMDDDLALALIQLMLQSASMLELIPGAVHEEDEEVDVEEEGTWEDLFENLAEGYEDYLSDEEAELDEETEEVEAIPVPIAEKAPKAKKVLTIDNYKKKKHQKRKKK